MEALVGDRNLSIYSVPAALFLALAPRAYTLSRTRVIDPRAPRAFASRIEKDQRLDKLTKESIFRAESAQSNGMETVGLFAAAVVVGNIAHLPPQTLNSLTGGYLISRFLYNIVYIKGTTRFLARMRTVVWAAGIGYIVTLFIKAGNKLAVLET